MTSYYEKMLNTGLKYQDFLTKELIRYGIILMNYSTKEYQNNYGEGYTRYEIKFDNKFKNTGNLYIELYERSDIKYKWTESGILRNDNTLFYLIGDYNKTYLFQKKVLQQIISKYRHVETPTSKGVLLPIDKIKKIANIIDHKNKTIT